MDQYERRFYFHGLDLAITFQLVTIFDISVDQFFYAEGHLGEDSCRKSMDVMLNSMDEKELVVMKATAEGLKNRSLEERQML